MPNHVQCIYCDARSDKPLCEECMDTLRMYRNRFNSYAPKAAGVISIDDFWGIIVSVAEAHSCRVTDLLPAYDGKAGSESLACARGAFYMALEGKGLNYARISEWVKRKRTTIWHAMHRFKEAANAA